MLQWVVCHSYSPSTIPCHSYSQSVCHSYTGMLWIKESSAHLSVVCPTFFSRSARILEIKVRRRPMIFQCCFSICSLTYNTTCCALTVHRDHCIFTFYEEINAPHTWTILCSDACHRACMHAGDTLGRIRSYNLFNGRSHKAFDSHSADVSVLRIWPGTDCLISASWDGTVKIHSDDPSISWAGASGESLPWAID